jgi:hypothetical protein
MNIKSYKKALLLCPPKYSLKNVFEDILRLMSDELVFVNVMEYVQKFEISINTQIFRLPDSVRSKWINYYQRKINTRFLQEFRREDPDLVFVYNNEMLLPSTIQKMKQTATVIFFLADTPFFTPTNNYFLTILTMGDLVLVPDSFWEQQMRTVGIRNSFYFIPGIDDSSYNNHPSQELMQKVQERDVLYCGLSYVNSWGFKKALFMSKFTQFDLVIYGDKHWKKWFHFFPDLKDVFHESGFIPTDLLNAMFNKTKLMPVDGNPAILNGFHIRMFEALGAGVLPLIEYRKDIEERVFNGLDVKIPIIRTYDEGATVAEHYLNNESLRLSTVSAMKDHVLSHYNAEKNAERILELLIRVKR